MAQRYLLAGWVVISIFFLLILNVVKGQICYEFGCHYTSHCDSDYENSTGVCYGKCTAGWYGPTCQLENVALGKPVYQNIPYTSNWRTGNIVDGNTSLDVCVDKAGLQGMDVFVEIDMKAVYSVKNVTIYYRPDGRDSLQGFSVGTTMIPDGDATNCYQHQLNEAIPSVINLECSVTGRYLYIKNSRSSPPYPQDYGLAAELELCEVLIFSCAKGTFGERCENMCHCHDDAKCDDRTGHCPESPSSVCEIGWTGERCDTECISTYGVNCSQKCEDRHCAGVTTCNPVNGSCDQGCEDEYMGVDCSYIAAKKCISTYGVNCSQKCEDRHCAGVTTCNPVNGSCDQGCEDEYMGVDCSYTALKTSLQVGHADDGLSKVTVGLIGVVCGCTFSLFIAFVVFKCCFKCRQRRKFSLSATRNRDTDIYASVYDSINDVNQPSGAVSNRTYGAGGRDETTRTSGSGRALPDIVVDDSLRSGTTPAEAPYIDMNKNSLANTASTPLQTQSANQYEDINDMKRGVTLNLQSGVEGCEYYAMDKNNKHVPETHESDNSMEATPNLQSDGAVCEYQTMKLDNVGYQNDELMPGSHKINNTTVENQNFPPEEDSSKYHNMKIRNVVYENDKPMVEALDSKEVSPNAPTAVSGEYQTMKLDNADNDKLTPEVSRPDGVEEAISNFPSNAAPCGHQDMNLENLGFENDEEIANSTGGITPNNQSDVSGCENHDYSVDAVRYYNGEQMFNDGRLPADQEDSEHKTSPRKDGALLAGASMDNETQDPELQNN